MTQTGRIGLSGLLGALLTMHPPSINTHMSARDVTMLVTLSVVWGGSFFFVAVAVEDLPPFTIVALRVGIAAIMLWGIVWLLDMVHFAGMSLIGVGLCAIDGRWWPTRKGYVGPSIPEREGQG